MSKLEELLSSLERNFSWSYDVPALEVLKIEKPEGFLDDCKRELQDLLAQQQMQDEMEEEWSEIQRSHGI